jgi:hypothetical protein
MDEIGAEPRHSQTLFNVGKCHKRPGEWTYTKVTRKGLTEEVDLI